MKIYALQGDSGTGKTTTLKLLYCLFLQEYPNAQILYCKHSRSILKDLSAADVLRETEEERKNPNRIKNLTVVLSVNGRVAGICTYGDGCKRLREGCDTFKKWNCDAAFTALHFSRAMETCLKSYDPSAEFICKELAAGEEEQLRVNKKQAEELLSLCRKMLS